MVFSAHCWKKCSLLIAWCSLLSALMPRSAMSASPAGQSLTAALQGAASDRSDFGSMTMQNQQKLADEMIGKESLLKVGEHEQD